jgi:spermidine synthase
LFFMDLNLEKYGLLFILLLIPTLLMGLSLPLLSKSIDLKNPKLQSQFIGNLYFINTLGASIGAIISGLVLIRWLGFQKSVELGALFNFICVILGLIISYPKNIEKTKVVTTKEPDSFIWNSNFKFWALQYFISGFISICFELIWFRILDVTIKSMAMTFSIVLGIYLISMAIGSRIGVIYSKKSKFITLKTYLTGQYLVYIYSLISILLVYYLSQNLNQLEYLFGYFGKYEASFEPKLILTIYLILPVFLMSVPTFLMGFNFSISQSLIQNDFDKIGRKIGYLQFINIIGATLGSWLITIIGFNYFGMASSIKILGIIGLSYVLFLKYSTSLTNLKTLMFGLLLSITIYLIPDNDRLWAIFQGVRDQKTIILDEDDTALSSIKMDIGHQNESIVFVNGLGQSILPFHKDSIHISLGGIPSMIHTSPIDIAIIGLGSGGTLNSVAGNPKTKSIDCFEVIKNQPRILKKYALYKNDKPVLDILNNPKVNLIFEDGRYSIQKKMKKYDIIQADALRPRSPYA